MDRILSRWKRNSRQFLSYVNSKRKISGYSTKISLDGVTRSEVSQICNLFADLLENVYLDQGVPEVVSR